MKKTGNIILLITLIPALLMSGCQNSDVLKAEKIIDYYNEQYDEFEPTGEIVNGVRVINIKAWQFYFEPMTIIVNKGEKLRITVEAMDTPHGFEIEGFEIPGYDINTVIRKGFPMTVEFIADEKGVWEFICSIYCGFGHSTMKGLFVVR